MGSGRRPFPIGSLEKCKMISWIYPRIARTGSAGASPAFCLQHRLKLIHLAQGFSPANCHFLLLKKEPVRHAMKSIAFYLLLIVICGFLCATGNSVDSEIISRFPAQNAANVNPDAHLKLTFASQPTIGKSGKIRVYDAADNRLIDVLDLSIPPGPTTSVGPSVASA